MKKPTSEQLGVLLHKSNSQPRRNQKRYLKDIGFDGSAEELDQFLELAAADELAIAEAARLDRHREITAKTIEAGVDGRVAEMIADLKLKMKLLAYGQDELAEACGLTQPLINKYLTGKSEPGSRNLAKMAAAMGFRWTLTASTAKAILREYSWGDGDVKAHLAQDDHVTDKDVQMIGIPTVYESRDGYVASIHNAENMVWFNDTVFSTKSEAEVCVLAEFVKRKEKRRG